QGKRVRRSPGPRRLRAGLEPQREDSSEEGLLSAEPAGGGPHQDELRGGRSAGRGQQPRPGVRARIERGAIAADRRRPAARAGVERGGAAFGGNGSLERQHEEAIVSGAPRAEATPSRRQAATNG